VLVPRAGRYLVWVEGSFGRKLTVAVDGRTVGDVSYELNGRREYVYLGHATLGAGPHSVVVSRSRGNLKPGDGGDNLLGPIVFVPPQDRVPRVSVVPAGRWRTLCGRELDWVEIVR
jgi:hypothetical protein